MEMYKTDSDSRYAYVVVWLISLSDNSTLPTVK